MVMERPAWAAWEEGFRLTRGGAGKMLGGADP